MGSPQAPALGPGPVAPACSTSALLPQSELPLCLALQFEIQHALAHLLAVLVHPHVQDRRPVRRALVLLPVVVPARVRVAHALLTLDVPIQDGELGIIADKSS